MSRFKWNSLAHLFGLFLIPSLGLAPDSALGSEIVLRGGVFPSGYYSARVATFELTYENLDLPWGSRVELVHGWSGHDTVIGSQGPELIELSWDQKKESPLSAVSPYRWGIAFSQTLGERSHPRWYDELDFVLRVQLPDGRILIEKGGDSAMGHYRASLRSLTELPRDHARDPRGEPGEETRPMPLIPFHSVEKH